MRDGQEPINEESVHLTSGQDNEVWSFGEDNYEIMKKYLFIRENLRDYVRQSIGKRDIPVRPESR